MFIGVAIQNDSTLSCKLEYKIVPKTQNIMHISLDMSTGTPVLIIRY